jgi:hypothetical protein
MLRRSRELASASKPHTISAMSLLNRIMRFARSPEGRRMVSEAGRYARNPQGRRRIDQVRRQLANGRRTR